MSSQIFARYPCATTSDQDAYLLKQLNDWAIGNGLAVRPPPTFKEDPAGVLATTAPVTLYPSVFPRKCFEEALAIQTVYNELYSLIARDEEWLGDIVKELAKVDDFIGKLWNVHEEVKRYGGYAQHITLGLFRSDYMLHLDPNSRSDSVLPQIKQIEFNTIASSFGGLSTKVSALHKYLQLTGAFNPPFSAWIKDSALPPNYAYQRLASGLAHAHKAYGESRTGRLLCVVFIVQDPERNVFDQRAIEYELQLVHKIAVFRIPFDDVMSRCSTQSDQTLTLNAPYAPYTTHEVSTVYFRAGYAPTDYKEKKHWMARWYLESSRAIKCPSVLTQLAGCKKVQQVLAEPRSQHLHRFMGHRPELMERVRETFAPIFPMSTETWVGSRARKLALDPETAKRFVLKPQREGGGNNVYRGAIPAFLKEIGEEKWPAYILMEMIEPPAARNKILRNGEVQEGGVICELGVYGVCLWKNPGFGKKSRRCKLSGEEVVKGVVRSMRETGKEKHDTEKKTNTNDTKGKGKEVLKDDKDKEQLASGDNGKGKAVPTEEVEQEKKTGDTKGKAKEVQREANEEDQKTGDTEAKGTAAPGDGSEPSGESDKTVTPQISEGDHSKAHAAARSPDERVWEVTEEEEKQILAESEASAAEQSTEYPSTEDGISTGEESHTDGEQSADENPATEEEPRVEVEPRTEGETPVDDAPQETQAVEQEQEGEPDRGDSEADATKVDAEKADVKKVKTGTVELANAPSEKAEPQNVPAEQAEPEKAPSEQAEPEKVPSETAETKKSEQDTADTKEAHPMEAELTKTEPEAPEPDSKGEPQKGEEAQKTEASATTDESQKADTTSTQQGAQPDPKQAKVKKPLAKKTRRRMKDEEEHKCSRCKGKMLINFEASYLLRTKGDQSEEGGVAAGFGAVDSCCLIDVPTVELQPHIHWNRRKEEWI